jgi:hypothetical protein
MGDEELDEVAANVATLIRAELDVQHRFGGHPVPATDCPACVSRGGDRP